MRTLEQARGIAIDQLSRSCEVGIEIIDRATKEVDEGWLFYYQSAEFIRTQNFSLSLVGNTPLFVPKGEESPFHVFPNRPLEESIEAYKSCGNPNAQPSSKVCLLASKPGVSDIDLLRLIRAHTSLGISEAKQVIAMCASSERPIVQTRDTQSARFLVQELVKVGVLASVQYGG